MNRAHWIAVGISCIVIVALFTLFDIVPPASKDLEKSRFVQLEATGIENLEKLALDSLDADQKSILEAIQLDLSKAKDTTRKVQVLQSLSGTWYDYGHPSIAGHYAEQVARLSSSTDTWSIAGTTYVLCYRSAREEKIVSFCWKRAVKAFEAAVSIDPAHIESRINLAICYTDRPQEDNPMQGILMLRRLNEEFPEDTKVLNQLARLALQTGQYDKALERLQASLKIDANNSQTACLMAEALNAKGDKAGAAEFEKKCVH